MATITGTEGADTLTGTGGIDTILGLGGGDSVDGGGGADVIEGGDGADTLLGGAGEDTIYGGAGNDFLVSSPLDGGPGTDFAFRDALAGQGGDDVYLADINDRVGEDLDGGFDVVMTRTGGVGLSINAYVEVVMAADAGSTNDMILGGNGNTRTIVGNNGANRISIGLGRNQTETVAATLIGLLGDDVYEPGLKSVIRENAGEGFDTVQVSVAASNYVLSADASVELMVADPSTSSPINITGNGSSQLLRGNGGANILSGGGGAPDTLDGGLGDDVYRVFSLGDTVVDTGGFDTVYASGTSYFLSTSSQIEYLSSSFQAGTEAIYLVGNAASQVIAGNYGANILDGAGGGAADTLIGLRGDDVYRVYTQFDTVRENASEGNDSVFTSANYQLRNGVSVEALSAENQAATGVGAEYILRGNELAQTIIGNDARNVLDGRGGNDVLIGRGASDDLFAFTTALDADNNVDTVQDFETFERIGLASDIFAAVASGGVTFDEFVEGTTARDADDRLIYDRPTGQLFYDADGNGAGAAVLFARLSPNLFLNNFNFVVLDPVGDAPVF